jgi:hypothetical protein
LVRYLPAYSPDLNPIEPSFHRVKSWIKRNKALAPAYGDANYQEVFQAFLDTACKAFSATVDHKQIWRGAGLNVDLVDIRDIQELFDDDVSS